MTNFISSEMESEIKLNFPFPKPYEQFNQINYGAKRREALLKSKLKHGLNKPRLLANDIESDSNLIVKYILKDSTNDLQNLLENKRCENILKSTKLELKVVTTKNKLEPQRTGHFTANINLLHLAVIERKKDILYVMLKYLEKNKITLKDVVLEPITVLEDGLSIAPTKLQTEVNIINIKQ